MELKWKGPYQIIKVLDKRAYKISIDGRELSKTVNENLLKRYHERSHYEPVIIIESDINREENSLERIRINKMSIKELKN